MGFTIKNPLAPATSKQLWFLKVLTGEDYSDKDLTMGQVSELIAAAKAGQPTTIKVKIEANGDKPHKLKDLMKLFVAELKAKGVEYDVE